MNENENENSEMRFDPQTGEPLAPAGTNAPEPDAENGPAPAEEVTAAEPETTPAEEAKAEKPEAAPAPEAPAEEAKAEEAEAAPAEETKAEETEAAPAPETPAEEAKAEETETAPAPEAPAEESTAAPEASDVPRFDPQTGEPLHSVQDDVPKFDPQTGEPLSKAPEDVPKFDPQTGEPLDAGKAEDTAAGQQAGSNPKGWKFDPKTGERIGGAPKAKNWKFDPKTGEALNPRPEKKVLKKPVIIAAILAAVVIVALIVVSAVLNTPEVVVARAFRNTIKKTADALTDYSALEDLDKEGSADISLSDPGDGVTLDMDTDWKEQEFSADGTVDYNDGWTSVNTGVSVYANDQYVAGTADMLDGMVFYYDYTKDNTGYVIDLLEEAGISQEDLNTALADLMDGESGKDKIDTKQLLSDLADEIDLEKTDSDTFEVNDKDVRCKGYSMELDNDTLDSIWGIIYDALDDAYDLSTLDAMMQQETGSSLENPFQDAGEFNVKITFYVHSSTLAAIVVRDMDTKDKMTIGIEGGDFPLQNITLRSGDEKYRIRGESEDGVYTGSFADDESAFSYSYDTDDGAYTLLVGGESVSGTFYGDDDDFEFSMNLTRYDDTVTLSTDFAKESDIKAIAVDENSYDLGNMTEDDFSQLGTDIGNLLY